MKKRAEYGVDWHEMRFKAGMMVPEHFYRTGGTRKDLISLMDSTAGQDRVIRGYMNGPYVAYSSGWAAVPGPKPKKEWGEVCL